jgi:hypothetical protein
MSSLSYAVITDYPFQPFTKIYSTDINLMFSTIQTYVNGTVAGSSAWIQRYGTASQLISGTANYVVYNDASGNLTEAAYLPTAQGGIGANLTPTSSLQAGQAITVNAAGNGFILSSSSGATSALYSFYNLG